jgi:type I restriction enzyme R subunit
VSVRNKVADRGQRKRADYLLFMGPNLPWRSSRPRTTTTPVGGGMQQALAYAEALDVPFVFTSNGDGFVFHDRTGPGDPVERVLTSTTSPARRRSGTATAPGRAVPDEEKRRAPALPRRRRAARSPATTSASPCSAPSRPSPGASDALPAHDGHRHRQDLHRLPDHLAPAGRPAPVKRVLFLADRNILADQTA